MSGPWTRIGKGPLLAGAVLGMVVTFAAGWALSSSRGSGSRSAQSTEISASSVSNSPSDDVLATGGAGGALAGPSSPTGSGGLPAVSDASKAPIPKFDCPPATVQVTTADQLTTALATARPGTVISLAAGMYQNRFETTRKGTAKKPIYLCGPRSAVLDGGGISKGYALHLDGASYWRITGFTVQNGQKGVMLDGVTGVALQDLLIQQIGDEAVHLRRDSSFNVVRELTIAHTGLRKPEFGEGVYIGTAQSNWCQVNGCQPDHSDDDFVLDNDISATGAESVDIKEGTSSGVLAGNRFDGTGITGADSWVDVKGNGWLIAGNQGAHAPTDGYQVHEILDGWGYRNLFSANISAVDASGFAIHVTKQHDQNVVNCSNQATGAAQGLTNITCS